MIERKTPNVQRIHPTLARHAATGPAVEFRACPSRIIPGRCISSGNYVMKIFIDTGNSKLVLITSGQKYGIAPNYRWEIYMILVLYIN